MLEVQLKSLKTKLKKKKLTSLAISLEALAVWKGIASSLRS